MNHPLWLLLLTGPLATLACQPATTPPATATRSACQPISGGAPGQCFLPFPSSYYLRADTTTATGFRVAIPVGVLPKNQVQKDFDPTRYNQLDGFSAGTQIIVDLGARVDAATLPGEHADPALTLGAGSTVQLIARDTGERVPLFAEVDLNVVDTCLKDEQCHGGATCTGGHCAPDETQAVLIHPLARLRPATRYVVALQNIKDRAGHPIVVAPFAALVNGKVAADSPLQFLVEPYRDLFSFLEKQGIGRGALTLTWDFVTASDTATQSPMLAIRDAAFARWEKDKLGWTVTEVNEPAADPHLYREIKGSFDVPSFLRDDKDPYSGLALDGAGHPMDSGRNYHANFLLHVPRCALTATHPLPIMVYGHGFFGASDEINADYQKALIDDLCMVQVATDWVGLDSMDSVYIPIKVFGSFDTFSILTDRLHQGVLDFLVLAHLAARRFGEIPELMVTKNGVQQPIVDGKEVYYFGCSQGGILGGTVLALSPDLTHAGLNVGSGNYSLMLTRSADFHTFKAIMDNTYPVQVDQQLLLALTQSDFDFTDPISFLGRGVHDPFTDPLTHAVMAPKRVVLQESIGDAQVPNLATRVLARSAGLTLLSPSIDAPWGLTPTSGPLPSAYTQWDVHAKPLPLDGDVPPADNPAHEAIRRLPALQEQLRRFFQPDGKVEDTCGGPCSFTK